MNADTDLDGLPDATGETPLPETPRMKRWRAMKEVAPELARLERRGWNQYTPPAEMSDGLFLALCACFQNPVKREILRALILDLLAEDLQALFVHFLTEEQQ